MSSHNGLKGGALIGIGGFGCVFSPAIVTNKDKLITQENKHQYVSKISHNPKREFKIIQNIIDIFQRNGIPLKGKNCPGWFPSDVHCFHIDSMLNPRAFLPHEDIRDANKKCVHIIEELFKEKLNNKGFLKNQEICITQIPRFTMTLDEFKGSIAELIQLSNEAFEKLKVLHSLDIYHLDIKPSNMAIEITPSGPSIYYNDWDIAAVLDFEDEDQKVFEFELARERVLDSYDYYFITLPQDLYRQNNINPKEVTAIFKHFNRPNLNLRIFMMKVDYLIFIATWYKLYKNLNYKQILFLISKWSGDEDSDF